jgi:hypothetical protein
MVRQIPGDVGEKLAEQGKSAGKALKQAPKTIFQRMVGEKTDEEKKADKEKRKAEEKGIEDVTSTSSQQPMSQTDLRRKQIKAEKQAKTEKMRKILHKKLFDEADKARKRKGEEERLKEMKEEDEKKKRQEEKTKVIEQKKKEEALAVRVAKRAKGAGEFGPKKPK